jgi:hypothetical protein
LFHVDGESNGVGLKDLIIVAAVKQVGPDPIFIDVQVEVGKVIPLYIQFEVSAEGERVEARNRSRKLVTK